MEYGPSDAVFHLKSSTIPDSAGLLLSGSTQEQDESEKNCLIHFIFLI
jgi:hypothetical protein